MELLHEYNKKTEEEYKKTEPYFQIGFFRGNMLFIGQNPGMPYDDKSIEDTEKMLKSEITYEDLIKSSNMGDFLSSVVQNWDDVSFTNLVKIPTFNNDIPSESLIQEHSKILIKQIELLKPRKMICIGATVGRYFGIERWYEKKKYHEIPMTMIPHPSWISRQSIESKNDIFSSIRWLLNQQPIINAWDSEDRSSSHFLIRSDVKKIVKTVSQFRWYFYVLKKDVHLIKDKYPVEIEEIANSHKVKVYCNPNVAEKIAANDIKTFEADISMNMRYIIDTNIPLEKNLRVLFFDIETDDRQEGIEIGRDKILSWAAVDMLGNKLYASFPKEIDTLLELRSTFDKYDLLVGWNSSKFDLPYVKERFKKSGIRYNFREIHHVDLMKRYIKLFAPGMTLMGLKSFSLNDMAETFLDETKVEISQGIYEMYKHNPEKLKEYNIQDVMLLKRLNDKMKTIDLMIEESSLTKTFMSKFFIGNLLDNYILNEGHKNNIQLPSKPTIVQLKEREKEIIRGAYVMSPKIGYYDIIDVFDFKSLYPSIIVGWNIGLDSLAEDLSSIAEHNFDNFLHKRRIENISISEWSEFLRRQKEELDPDNKYIQSANNQFFDNCHESFIGNLVQELLSKREIYKKELDKYVIGTLEYNNAKAQQEIVKEMANSMFGITADKDSRYYDKRICEAITLTGQYITKLAADIFQKHGDVIYGDTDSIFMKLETIDGQTASVKVNDELRRIINSLIPEKKNIVKLMHEKTFSKFILLDKKRYCGLMTQMDGKNMEKMFYRGIEVIQKNTIRYARKRTEELLSYIIKDDKPCSFLQDWLTNMKHEVMNAEFDINDIVIRQKINKPIDSYKTEHSYTRLARKMIDKKKMIDVTEKKNSWSQLKYVIVDMSKKKECLAEEYTGIFDRQHYWSTRIFSPMRRILETVYPHVDWMIYDLESMNISEQMRRNQLTLL